LPRPCRLDSAAASAPRLTTSRAPKWCTIGVGITGTATITATGAIIVAITATEDTAETARPVPKGAGRLHFGSAVDPAQSAA